MSQILPPEWYSLFSRILLHLQELSDSEGMLKDLKGAVKNMRRKNAGKDAIGELKDEIKCFKDSIKDNAKEKQLDQIITQLTLQIEGAIPGEISYLDGRSGIEEGLSVYHSGPVSAMTSARLFD